MTRRVGGGWAILLSVLWPGAGHVLVERRGRGLRLMLGWAAIQAFHWVVRSRLYAGGKSLDDWVAAATFAAVFCGTWAWALWDVTEPAEPVPSPARPLAASGKGSGRGTWAIARREFRRNRLAVIGVWVVAGLYALALMAPLVAPYNPIAQQNLVTAGYLPPSPAHLLGTDQFGRDVLSRIIYGARISLAIGFIAVALAVVLGSLLGAVAGYLGGKVDAAVMRFTDMVLAFPRLVLLIMVIALFSPTITLIILVLGLTLWPGTARLVRGEVLSLREREYIQAARALGLSRGRIILRHLIPNVLAPVIVAATLGIGNTIVLEAGLSFLGLGVQPPTASWGNMVADGRQNLLGAWWVATFPGLVIVLTVLAFNLVGDGLRDALDPRLRK